MAHESTGIEYSLIVNTEQAEEATKKLQHQLMLLSQQLIRMTGSDDMRTCMAVMQRLQTLAAQMRVTVAATHAAAGAGPVGWLLAGVSWVGLGLSAVETMNYISSQSRGY
jgi:hypothetical protein